MAARFASSGNAFARLVREYQDLDQAWSAKDNELIRLRDVEGKNKTAFDEARRQIADIELRRLRVVSRLRQKFPEYAHAQSVASKQQNVDRLIDRDEVLIFWQLGDTESYVFALVTWMGSNGLDGNTKWKRIPVSTENSIRHGRGMRTA